MARRFDGLGIMTVGTFVFGAENEEEQGAVFGFGLMSWFRKTKYAIMRNFNHDGGITIRMVRFMELTQRDQILL